MPEVGGYLSEKTIIFHMMKEKNILHWIIPAIILSLVGLGIVQILLLKDTYEQKDQAFEKNVLNAMRQVTRSLETRDARLKVSRLITGKNPRSVLVMTNSEGQRSKTNPDSVSFKFNFAVANESADSVFVRDGMVFIIRPRSGFLSSDTFESSCVANGENNAIIKKITISADTGLHRYDSTLPGTSKLSHTLKDITFDSTLSIQREELIASVFDVLDDPRVDDSGRGIKPNLIDSLLRRSLTESGLNTPFVFGIKNDRSSSLRYVNDSTKMEELLKSPFTASFLPSQIPSSSTKLVVFFPERQIFLLRQLAPSVLASIAFIALILGLFFYSIRTIHRQKLFAVRLTEFVNNITHEFKTPISTISVITDTLSHPEVSGSSDKVQHYNKIVQDEINRLKTHVDKILQIAVLEEGDYEFNMKHLDAHDIIKEAAERFSVKVNERQGMITTDLKAEKSVINADQYHFVNIIMNLLDNAEKYSAANPVITIVTGNDGGMFWLRVDDKGIGIAERDREHIFEKYYRVSTGDRHDVKGFGLGLSYVNLIVKAHRGTVGISSTPGVGTSVTVSFPFMEA
jgi:signal transduction histidine kinase